MPHGVEIKFYEVYSNIFIRIENVYETETYVPVIDVEEEYPGVEYIEEELEESDFEVEDENDSVPESEDNQ